MLNLVAMREDLLRSAAVELDRRLPVARFETIEGAGHIPHRTHPDEDTVMLTEFIDTVTAEAAVSGGRR